MNKLSLIVAMGKNGEIGYQESMPWPRLTGDMKFFKEMTTGKSVIMGKRTFDTLPRLLINRHHIIMTRHPENFQMKEEKTETVELVSSKEELFNKHIVVPEVYFNIGGYQIYNEFMDDVDTMYITHIDSVFPQADTYFPIWDKNEWDSEFLGENEEKGFSYKRIKYKKK